MTEPKGVELRSLRTLNRVMKALLAGEDYDRMLDRVMGEVLVAMGAERGYLVVPSKKGEGDEDFLIRAVRNWSQEQIKSGDGAVSRSIVKDVIKTGRPILLRDALTSAYGDAVSVQQMSLASILAAPLLAPDGKELLGVAYLESRAMANQFSDDDKDLLGEVLSLSGKVLTEVIRREEAESRARSMESALLAEQRFPGIITREPIMHAVLQTVSQVATSDVPVLVIGESGTGKELVARALHLNSDRAQKPFLTVNCGAFAEHLLESEMFGHVKGSFTGAMKDRRGLFEAAHGGTLFLDEIGEMPPSLQVKLLRTLQFGEYKPVGSDETRVADVRIVSATNRDLEEEVRAGSFRQDLLYRLNTITVELPALRERIDDIPLLFQHFAQRVAERRNIALPRLSPEIIEVITRYDWPGNVRELENEAERIMALGAGRFPVLEPSLLSRRVLEAVQSRGEAAEDPRELTSRVNREERIAILEALEKENSNRTRAAKRLGVSRETLRLKMKKYGIA